MTCLLSRCFQTVAGECRIKQKNPDGVRVGVRFLVQCFIDLERAPRGMSAGKPEITKKAVGAVLHSGDKYYDMLRICQV
ncbi:MAG: hypothetical protein CMJ19_21925 [Phycisphaeraceae bacterium]|nr:hypothetical protein [Phycisphaeraceae bacterium]